VNPGDYPLDTESIIYELMEPPRRLKTEWQVNGALAVGINDQNTLALVGQ
jgi:hypothetical protein